MSRQAVTLSTTTVKGHTYWQLRWNDPSSGKRRSENIGRHDQTSERQARKRLSLKIAELELNPGMRAGSHTPRLGDWCRTFIAHKKAEGTRPATLKLYDLAARFLLAFFGDSREIHTVTKTDAKAFAAALRSNELDHIRYPEKNPQPSGGDAAKRKPSKPMGAVTARKHLANCRAIFAAAAEELDQMRGNPFRAVALPKVDPRQWRKVSGTDFWRLYGAAEGGWKMLLALCRLAGLRRSDALALRWSMVDWDRMVLSFVQAKTGRPCQPPICPELAAILREAPRPLSIEDDFVVPRPVYVDNLGRDFAVLFRRAKVTPYRDPLHTLRKSCIDDWAKSGYPASVVKDWAGHADIKTTLLFYGQVEDRDVRRAVTSPLLAKSDVTLDVTGPTEGIQSDAKATA